MEFIRLGLSDSYELPRWEISPVPESHTIAEQGCLVRPKLDTPPMRFAGLPGKLVMFRCENAGVPIPCGGGESPWTGLDMPATGVEQKEKISLERGRSPPFDD